MDHISKMKTEDKTHPPSPNTSVSQSKFLSPCRRVGLKRSSNKFVVKFKEIVSPKENNKNNKKILGSKKCSVFSSAPLANDLSNSNRENCDVTEVNKVILKDNVNEIIDSCDKDVNRTIISRNICVSTEMDHADSEDQISNNSYPEKDQPQSDLDISIPENTDKCVPGTGNNISNIFLNTTKIPTNCSDSTGSNPSKCDSLNISNTTCTNDIGTEDRIHVRRTPCNTISKTKTVKRFQNPMKQNFVVKKLKLETDSEELSHIEKRISEKERKIAEMKVTIANSTKHDINNLDKLISKWRTGCQEALTQLLVEIKRRGSEDYNLDKLLAELNIPHELVQYSETDQDFY